MKIKGKYVALVEIGLETEDTDNETYNQAVKEYWADIHNNVEGKLEVIDMHKFTNVRVTQQLFTMYEDKT